MFRLNQTVSCHVIRPFVLDTSPEGLDRGILRESRQELGKGGDIHPEVNSLITILDERMNPHFPTKVN